MATALHSDPARRRRVVMNSEVREMRRLALKGWSSRRIGAHVGRNETTVQRYCRGLLVGRRLADEQVVLAAKEARGIANGALAELFGYASAESVAVVVSRARRGRALLAAQAAAA